MLATYPDRLLFDLIIVILSGENKNFEAPHPAFSSVLLS
jgi:hypothetical protein